jgi:hypothetical protein
MVPDLDVNRVGFYRPSGDGFAWSTLPIIRLWQGFSVKFVQDFVDSGTAWCYVLGNKPDVICGIAARPVGIEARVKPG